MLFWTYIHGGAKRAGHVGLLDISYYTTDGRFFGTCFSVFRHKKGTVASVDYSSTFATDPFLLKIRSEFICILYFSISEYELNFALKYRNFAII